MILKRVGYPIIKSKDIIPYYIDGKWIKFAINTNWKKQPSFPKEGIPVVLPKDNI